MLTAKHISRLALKGRYEELQWLQLMLGRTWIAEIEKTIPVIPTRQPSCLTIIENHEIIGFTILIPKNRKGTCWEIKIPELIKESTESRNKDIYQRVLQKAITLKNDLAHSWLIKCDVTNTDQIAIARELGFQPLKFFKCWSINLNQEVKTEDSIELPGEFEWKPMTDLNVPIIWPQVRSGQSQILRHLLDRNYTDLLLENSKGCGMINQRIKKESAIISVVGASNSLPVKTFEIIRGSAWDTRIPYVMPWVLKNLRRNNSRLLIESNSEDNKLNECLTNNGCSLETEKMLLGRTIWKRKTSKGIIKGAKSIESMIERLQPQSPPMPTPTNGRSYKDV